MCAPTNKAFSTLVIGDHKVPETERVERTLTCFSHDRHRLTPSIALTGAPLVLPPIPPATPPAPTCTAPLTKEPSQGSASTLLLSLTAQPFAPVAPAATSPPAEQQPLPRTERSELEVHISSKLTSNELQLEDSAQVNASTEERSTVECTSVQCGNRGTSLLENELASIDSAYESVTLSQERCLSVRRDSESELVAGAREDSLPEADAPMFQCPTVRTPAPVASASTPAPKKIYFEWPVEADLEFEEVLTLQTRRMPLPICPLCYFESESGVQSCVLVDALVPHACPVTGHRPLGECALDDFKQSVRVHGLHILWTITTETSTKALSPNQFDKTDDSKSIPHTLLLEPSTDSSRPPSEGEQLTHAPCVVESGERVELLKPTSADIAQATAGGLSPSSRDEGVQSQSDETEPVTCTSPPNTPLSFSEDSLQSSLRERVTETVSITSGPEAAREVVPDESEFPLQEAGAGRIERPVAFLPVRPPIAIQLPFSSDTFANHTESSTSAELPAADGPPLLMTSSTQVSSQLSHSSTSATESSTEQESLYLKMSTRGEHTVIRLSTSSFEVKRGHGYDPQLLSSLTSTSVVHSSMRTCTTYLIGGGGGSASATTESAAHESMTLSLERDLLVPSERDSQLLVAGANSDAAELVVPVAPSPAEAAPAPVRAPAPDADASAEMKLYIKWAEPDVEFEETLSILASDIALPILPLCCEATETPDSLLLHRCALEQRHMPRLYSEEARLQQMVWINRLISRSFVTVNSKETFVTLLEYFN